jgi:tetratricopeptide (TPR) repeat protein
MAIRGSLHEAALPDVIQLLYLGRRTGCLAVADRHRHASVYFEDGWVTHAAIVNRRDRLGDRLGKSGRITLAQLDQAISMQSTGRHGQRLGAILVSLGAITREELTEAIHRQVEEAVFTLFHWTSGTFSFDPGVRPDEDAERVRIAPDALLLEGARRVDEWSLIEKKIPSFDLVFAVDRSQGVTPDLDFTETQHRIIPLVDGQRDVRGVVTESGLTEFEVCQALYGLITAGLVHRIGTSQPAATGRSLDMQIEEHRNLGVAFLRTGMLDEAMREFRRVVELRPAEGTAPFFLGIIAARQQRWADAAQLLRKAMDRAGPRPAILHNLGVALEMLGEPEQAEVLLADAAGRDPEHPRIQLSWGLAALGRGDVQLAGVRLARARELFGERVPAVWYWAASRACALGGDLEGALSAAGEGAERYPSDAVLLNTHAVLLEATGDLGAAEAVLSRALGENPSLAQVSKNLGDVLYRLGRYEEAWDSYQRVLRLRPELGDDLHFKLGNLALKRGDPGTARDHWARAVELNPRHQLARANLQTLAGT